MRKMLLGIFAGLVVGVTLTAGVRVVKGKSEPDGGLSSVVPDMDRIYRSALSNLFEAGGEQFTDPELKAFYDRLTKDITESLDDDVEFDPGITLEPETSAGQ